MSLRIGEPRFRGTSGHEHRIFVDYESQACALCLKPFWVAGSGPMLANVKYTPIAPLNDPAEQGVQAEEPAARALSARDTPCHTTSYFIH